ncbi:MAG: hypothetical protein ACXVUE_12240 [Solirubrobacteraceae bacterium]
MSAGQAVISSPPARRLPYCPRATRWCLVGLAQSGSPKGVAVDSSGDVYVDDHFNKRIDQFSTAGAFVKTWGWGVADGAAQFETCTSSCHVGIPGGGAGQLNYAEDLSTDDAGEVYVADTSNNRIDEFSPSGAFTEAWGVRRQGRRSGL